MVHLLIYLQGDLLVCDVIGRYVFCVVLLADACLTKTFTTFTYASGTGVTSASPSTLIPN